MEGFLFENADEALKFFEACEAEKADTLEKRTAILRRFVKEKQVKYVPHPDELLKSHNVIVVKQEPQNGDH